MSQMAVNNEKLENDARTMMERFPSDFSMKVGDLLRYHPDVDYAIKVHAKMVELAKNKN